MIDDIIGKPYQENGRGPDGYDCYGVCIEVCKKIGIGLPEVNELTDKKFDLVDAPRLGDIVFIDSCDVRHVGVMLDSKVFLTVLSTGTHDKVHKMRLSHPWVRGRIIGIYRYAE